MAASRFILLVKRAISAGMKVAETVYIGVTALGGNEYMAQYGGVTIPKGVVVGCAQYGGVTLGRGFAGAAEYGGVTVQLGTV